jgi:hypothetical protein
MQTSTDVLDTDAVSALSALDGGMCRTVKEVSLHKQLIGQQINVCSILRQPNFQPLIRSNFAVVQHTPRKEIVWCCAGINSCTLWATTTGWSDPKPNLCRQHTPLAAVTETSVESLFLSTSLQPRQQTWCSRLWYRPAVGQNGEHQHPCSGSHIIKALSSSLGPLPHRYCS